MRNRLHSVICLIIAHSKTTKNTGLSTKVRILVYSGDLVHDCKEGFGKLTLSNGEFYKGEFKDDKPNGKGFFSGLKEQFHGVWSQGQLVKKN
jgi:hypothetical protein